MGFLSFFLSFLVAILGLLTAVRAPVNFTFPAPTRFLRSNTAILPATPLSPALPPNLSKTSAMPNSSVTSPSVPWGTTEKLGDHLYRTYVGSDPVMGTPDEILTALNNYRHDHGVGNTLRTDENICQLAQSRAQIQDKAGGLDSHKGLIEYLNDPNHWTNLNVKAIGENASYGYVLSGVHLIEWVFDADAEHRENQLNPQWNLACAGVSGSTVDIIFGER